MGWRWILWNFRIRSWTIGTNKGGWCHGVMGGWSHSLLCFLLMSAWWGVECDDESLMGWHVSQGESLRVGRSPQWGCCQESNRCPHSLSCWILRNVPCAFFTAPWLVINNSSRNYFSECFYGFTVLGLCLPTLAVHDSTCEWQFWAAVAACFIVPQMQKPRGHVSQKFHKCFHLVNGCNDMCSDLLLIHWR